MGVGYRLAFRCKWCDVEWPNSPDYLICPVCRTRTLFGAGNPLTNAEARSIVRGTEFDEFYREREGEREGPTPEEVGEAEARDLIEKWKEVEASYGEGR